MALRDGTTRQCKENIEFLLGRCLSCCKKHDKYVLIILKNLAFEQRESTERCLQVPIKILVPTYLPNLLPYYKQTE